MPITPLPTPPSRQDPTTFSARADAFLAALPQFATEMNAGTPGESAFGLAQSLAEPDGATLIGTSAAGSGSVERELQEKLNESISVQDKGAIEGGTVDATAAFNAAWAASSPAAAFVLPGEYLITGTVTGLFVSNGPVTIIGGTVNHIASSTLVAAVGATAQSYRVGLKYGQMDATVRGSYLFDGRESYPNKLGVNNTKPVDDPTTGARTDDAGYVASGANVAAILSGYDNVNNALAGLVASQHSMIYAGGDHASIIGGSLHTILDGADYSSILGGTSNTIEGRGQYAAIVSGDQNKIETGASESVSGFRSFIASSSACTIGGRNGTILAGVSSSIQSTYGTIFGGETVVLTDGTHMGAGGRGITMGASAASAYSFAWGLDHTIDGGRSAAFGEGHTVSPGHDFCYAFGLKTITPAIGAHVSSARHRGGTAGRNQSIQWTASQETTDATLTNLSVAGIANYAIQPEDSVVNGTCLVVGVKTSDGTTSAFEVKFTSKRVGSGTPTLVYNNTSARVNALSLGTHPTMNTAAGGAYRIGVVGLAATDIAWDAVMTGHQIIYTP